MNKMNRSWTINNLEDHKKMFDDIFEKDYRVIIVANQRDLWEKFHIADYSSYFKSVFGENTISVEFPPYFSGASHSFGPMDLIQKGQMLFYVETNSERCSMPYFVWDMFVKPYNYIKDND
jgi:ribosome biogenesis GTPase A